MMKETAVFNVGKEALAFNKNDTGFKEYIIKHLSTELVDRIMTILEHEPEIVIRQSDLLVEEFMPTNSVMYRRFVEWNRLVRCKDCRFYDPEDNWCRRLGLCGAFNAESFCSHGERREDGKG